MNEKKDRKNSLFGSELIVSLVASAIWTVICWIIKAYTDIQQMVYIAIPIQPSEDVSLKTDQVFWEVKVKLWLAGIIVILLIGLFYWLGYMICSKRIRKIKDSLNMEKDCGNCSKVEELIRVQDEVAIKVREQEEWKQMMGKLEQYTHDSEVVDSIQLFEYSPLPDCTNLNPRNLVDISFRFTDGCTKSSANVNVLYNMNYQFGYNIYEALIELFKKRNDYYSSYSKRADKEIEKSIQSQAIEVFDTITELLNNIPSENEIEDVHYAYYRMLEVLTNVVMSQPKAIECRQFLVNQDVEKNLKIGQRTGMLGTLFSEATYSFCNENSITKSNRSYFSTPLEYKNNKMILLVVLERDKLRLGPNGHDDVRCCENIYDEITRVLNSKSA